MHQNKPNIGFYYDVTEKEIIAHKKRSIPEIFNWLEDANSFVASIQTESEKKNVNLARGVNQC